MENKINKNCNSSISISYKETPLLTQENYRTQYTESIENPETFWSRKAEEFLTWETKWEKVYSGDFSKGEVKWFEGGKLNVSYNCIDRHIENGHGEKLAIIWEGNEIGENRKITYKELQEEVCRLGNVLKDRGIKKGDRVCIYMPMIPESAFAMLACTRIGAIHTVVFGGFSHEALSSRINDAKCSAIITADFGKRGDKIIPIKEQVDKALINCPSIHTSIVVKTDHSQKLNKYSNEIEIDYKESISNSSAECIPEIMDSEDPLFILYTSGSTGKPKGVVHTTAGFLLWASITHKYVFDLKENDVYWCTADVGWITGHSFVVYGPLCNGTTTLMYEGVPTYPDSSRYWKIIDKYNVNIFYSTPTALRLLMAQGNNFTKESSRKSLKILGTAGEPINPEAWQWYYETIGNKDCPIMDTWWQTEVAGPAITPFPCFNSLKPGAASKPFFGIQPVILDDSDKEIIGEGSGKLMLKGSWPGQVRTLYNNHERFFETYFKAYPGYYLTGDGAMRDVDGDLWVTGRIDDVMEVSGHLIGTAEIESSFTKHSSVAESAVVSIPHEIKGESIYAFVTLIKGEKESQEIKNELIILVKENVGSFAKPDNIKFVGDLPKTRSGKIMRRILRKIAQGQTEDLGDITTLADQKTVSDLITKLKSDVD